MRSIMIDDQRPVLWSNSVREGIPKWFADGDKFI